MSKAMRLTPAQLVDIKARIAGRPSVTAMRDNPAERQRRRERQHACQRIIHGLPPGGGPERNLLKLPHMLRRARRRSRGRLDDL